MILTPLAYQETNNRRRWQCGWLLPNASQTVLYLTETELIIVKLHKFQKSYTCKQLQPSNFFLTNVSIIVRDLGIYSGISKMSGSVLYLVTSNEEDWLIFPRIVKKET